MIPALCVADSLRKMGAGVGFVGSESGIESELVPAAGYPLHRLPLSGLSGGLAGRALAVYRLGRALAGCLRLVRRSRVGAVLGVGGYASAPAVLAARMLGVPTFLHEQNSVPGKVNRFASRLTREVLVTFPAAKEALENGVNVGMPTRPQSLQAAGEEAREQALERLGLEPPVVVIFGGSGGALHVNLAAAEAFSGETGYSVVQVAGRRDYPRLSTDNPRHRIVEYEPEMWRLLAAADVVVSRAGAGSLFDVAAAGKAAILVPYPYAAGGHQLENARYFTLRGAAELMFDEEVTPTSLRNRVERLLDDDGRRTELGRRMAALATPGASDEVARRMLKAAATGSEEQRS
ncbi:UDP-N-acetylglucosamine--N-acetylmuramyl-(pentapeptide) pyrophosphoryl-undecaprenol N-acetylglucosamine transferase [Rubrobacter aplysinae]|uniref:UDP-N-acetylglucosamine--N-acetylmuramyl- (pentapeptide) pyrophosphoryl-undecaprenol N-acetylglucosamine transferase n=1 Tax=Rubrobacter aplysinae TaxID=909625 RepID=UPI001364A702|nr:UDP-N-acetylglucosamine--N-acetylmuramyl-(pentapeptide) pyrophosphoryl-undecaprenol N-acetylglucosamine transferase [Rubrobacter aplysinae]